MDNSLKNHINIILHAISNQQNKASQWQIIPLKINKQEESINMLPVGLAWSGKQASSSFEKHRTHRHLLKVQLDGRFLSPPRSQV